MKKGIAATRIKKTAALVPQEKPFAELQARVPSLDGWLTTKRIANDNERQDAGVALKLVKTLAEQCEEKRTAITKPMNAALKEVNAQAKQVSGPLERLETHLKRLLVEHELAKRAEAEKLAEKQATKAEKQGAVQLAEDIRTNAAEQPVVASVEGLTTRTTYKARVTDLNALLQAVVEGHAIGVSLREELSFVAEKILSSIARGAKGQVAPVPGVEFYEEKIASMSL